MNPESIGRHILFFAAAAFVFSPPLPASDASAKPESGFTISGDVRLRYEWDWDSRSSSGAARADRDRARARARIGFAWKPAQEWTVGARARTGSHLGQHSTHLTFYANDGSEDDFDGSLDRYFVQFKRGTFTGWAGRNSFPFERQVESFWDDDITPTGVAGIYETKLGGATVTTTLGAFRLPDGATHLNGSLGGGQLRYTREIESSQLTVAAALYSFNGREGATRLRNRNGARDYLVGILSAQWVAALQGAMPVILGAGVIKNFANYDAADVAPFPPTQVDDTNGWEFSIALGRTKAARDWQVGYYFAHIETFAVNAAYSQDDWARFGSGPQPELSDFRGHELRGTYMITKQMNVVARFFIVDAITTLQDGKRFRIDLNWRF